MEELLLIDKPQGMTSFGVVARVRRALGGVKVGHGGTLDPRATGLLILGIGEGTKRLSEYLKLPKTYEATIRLGVRTDSGDLDGAVLEERDVPALTEPELNAAIEGLFGTQRLPVSAYSAIKREGEPLYKKARRGEAVTPPLRDMEVRGAVFISYDAGAKEIQAHFDVGSGTYIRSLAEEVGKRLGTIATLSALRRTRIGGFRIEDAETLEALEERMTI